MPSETLTIVCSACKSTIFEVIPDGATAYILTCAGCGVTSEVTFAPNVKVELVEPATEWGLLIDQDTGIQYDPGEGSCLPCKGQWSNCDFCGGTGRIMNVLTGRMEDTR